MKFTIYLNRRVFVMVTQDAKRSECMIKVIFLSALTSLVSGQADIIQLINSSELCHQKRALIEYADYEVPAQPTHLRNLITAFPVRLYSLQYRVIQRVERKDSYQTAVAVLGFLCSHRG